MSRAVAGRLNGIHAEVGTLVGPIWTGEVLVAIENDEGGTVFGYPTKDELIAARTAPEPRSVTEARFL